MWAMMPLVVYGYDTDAGRAWIADRAKVPLEVSTAELAAGRGRVKNVRHRLLLPDPPDEGRLAAAVRKGIWDCIQLFTEAPPKGTRNNFGLQAYRWWSELLARRRLPLVSAPVRRRHRHVVVVAPRLPRGRRRGSARLSVPAWAWCGARRLPVPRADRFEPPAALPPQPDSLP